jgi:AraC-like DNA-binding protein
MILTELPDLPPRPETPANAAFRRDYVARWARENTLLCGASRFAEYPEVRHPLSIKMAWGGPEVYHLPRRDVRVADGSWLVLNEGDRYGSTLKSDRPATSFSIFVRLGLADEVIAAQALGLERGLERGAEKFRAGASSTTFSPHLRGNDRHVTPRMRFIYERVMAGERGQHWFDEQSMLLVGDLLAAENEARAGTMRLPASKASTRAELSRRLRLAADHIETHYDQPLPLEALARIACMSSYHFLRYFSLLHGVTPHAYVVRCRSAAARRMLADGITDATVVARRSGFGSRSSLYRALRGKVRAGTGG